MIVSSRLLLIACVIKQCSTFTTTALSGRNFGRLATHIFSTANTKEIEAMRAGEMKKELESYGISTRSFLEKDELVEALKKARSDGLKPKSQTEEPSTATDARTSSDASFSQSSSRKSTTSQSSSSSSSKSEKSREERLLEERERCRLMKAGDLRKELEARSISTKSFFEKTEFVNALAEAIVDGVDKGSQSNAGGINSGEGYAEYSNVEVITDDSTGPRKKKNRDQQEEEQNPFGGGGGNPNPFGGSMGGGMPGGMDMGNIGDMLKNMGKGGASGGGGSNPFGGAGGGNPFGGGMGGGNPFGGGMGGGNPFGGGMGGGNPFSGDMAGKAQEMMNNPKVMEIMAKAQSNPKIAKAMQEVMANPTSMAKYQNDPEIAELMRELQKYL